MTPELYIYISSKKLHVGYKTRTQATYEYA